MKILGISNPSSGCGFHRVILPIAFMNDITGNVTNALTKDKLDQQWNIILFNRLSPFDGHYDLLRKEYGVKIVMDIDDDWHLPTNHLNYNQYHTHKDRIENNLSNADLVTCTNIRLANKILPFNKNVEILPNALPYGLHQFTDTKIESEYTRLFWCGGISHEGDLEILKNPVRRLSGRNDIQMVIGGYDDVNHISKWLWDKMVHYFTSAKKLNHLILNTKPVDQYMELYEHGDISLIPLLKSEWSGCKSNLKVLESACKMIPCIVSSVDPYIDDVDAPLFFVKNQSDWNKHLNHLLNNKHLISEYGKETYNWAKKHYNLETINRRRYEVYRNLIKA